MAEILQLAATIEWIVLGVVVANALRNKNKRIEKLLDSLEKEMNDGKT